jgi:hypothetical protein
MGNLPKPLFDSLYVVITIEYTNVSKTINKELRKIYSVSPELAEKKLPQPSKEIYTKIDAYLNENK